jgi:hypothetical protein
MHDVSKAGRLLLRRVRILGRENFRGSGNAISPRADFFDPAAVFRHDLLRPFALCIRVAARAGIDEFLEKRAGLKGVLACAGIIGCSDGTDPRLIAPTAGAR